jgi:hypothetical protein
LVLIVLAFQIEFTRSWTRALFRIYRALRLSTSSDFSGSTFEALTAGILVSPIIPFVLLVLALAKLGDPTQVGPNVVQPLLVLGMLLLAGNGISLAAAIMNYRVLKRLTQWANAQHQRRTTADAGVGAACFGLARLACDVALSKPCDFPLSDTNAVLHGIQHESAVAHQ